MKKAEIRKDYLLDRYVLISSKRGKRPHEFKEQALPQEDSRLTPEAIKKNKIPVIETLGSGPKQVCSVINPFPAVTISNRRARGRQEVIIETPDPTKALVDLGASGIARVLEIYARRTKALLRDKRLNYILWFKNEGPLSGASLRHAHSQIFASEFVSPAIKKELELLGAYKDKTGNDFYADLIKKEMKSPRRIFENKHIAVFAPYASMHAYEAWIIVKRSTNIIQLGPLERSSVAQALHSALAQIKKLGLSYNIFCHHIKGDTKGYLIIKFQPRSAVWAGIESDSGLIINSVAPEEAAKMYRKAFKKG